MSERSMAVSTAPNGKKRHNQDARTRCAISKTEHRPEQKWHRRIKQNRIRIWRRVIQNHGTRYYQAKRKGACVQSTVARYPSQMRRTEDVPDHTPRHPRE